ncbi:MAG TPA: (2Fe-2S)-binding protein [Melioribacteraceae bacterium]|nr:(2Fe-2S)-binding protein [Melioribacteraceae bacterium]
MKQIIKFNLNGILTEFQITKNKRLLDFLRDDCNLLSVKEGCGIGECGACTVLVNNLAVNSCLILTSQISGAEIYTIEGLKDIEAFNKLQNNFLKHGAVQCGFCTPGMLISAYALLLKKSDASIQEIKEAISGNLCRCTGYVPIINAVKETIEKKL